MATQYPSNQSKDGNGHRSTRDIEYDIERTRGEMDETLDELSQRLSPRHLLDEVYGFVRSNASGAMSKEDLANYATRATKLAAREIKNHPIPSLLIGAGLAWLLFESEEDDTPDYHSQWADIPEYSGSFVDARTGEPYDLETYGSEWKQEVPAWRQGYDWSKSDVNEETWTERAKQTLDDILTTVSDTTRSAADKMKHVSSRLMSLSGHKRRELHSRWANLREHSGSFVDARTGEPYDENYGREWRSMMACDYCATGDEEKQSWSEKAQHALEEMQQSLSSAGGNVKDQVQALAAKVGDFVGGTRDMSAGFASSVGHRAGQAGRSIRRGARYVGRQTRKGGASAQHQLSQGYAYSRDTVSQAMDEYPLAAGAACLGLGLLLGLVLPNTRAEDRMMGETSDQMKRFAKETGREAAERAKHVAQSTAAAAMEEAESQGLTPRQMGEKVQHAASEVKHAVTAEAGGANVGTLAEKVQRVAEKAVQTAKEEAKHETQAMTSKESGSASQTSPSQVSSNVTSSEFTSKDATF